MTKKSERLSARTLLGFINEANLSIAAERLGVRKQVVSRWLKDDTHLTIWKADTFATRLGHHPLEIWGDEWFRM